MKNPEYALAELRRDSGAYFLGSADRWPTVRSMNLPTDHRLPAGGLAPAAALRASCRARKLG